VTDGSRWLPPPRAELPGKRLFCLPFAGGGASFYAGWARQLGDVELCAFRLPGREQRILESPLSDLQALIPPLLDSLRARVDAPYALFGHSLGGLVAFELARAARRAGLPAPDQLFVSGSSAPDQARIAAITHLPDREFLDRVREYGGMPEQVLREPELLELILPALRADFRVSETYSYAVEPPLECPIVALGGTDDIPEESLRRWAAQTSGPFTLWMFSGGHFFLRDHQAEIVKRLVALL